MDRYLLLKEILMYIPTDEGIKLRILERCHDRKTAGHLGQRRFWS
jgi:hypothetical protein